MINNSSDNGKQNPQNIGKRLRVKRIVDSLGFMITATFKIKSGVMSITSAQNALDGILSDLLAFADSHDKSIVMAWSLVEKDSTYHAHILTSWLPTKMRVRLYKRELAINRSPIIQILHDNLSYTDKPQERIVSITESTQNRVLRYVQNQWNGGAVLRVGWTAQKWSYFADVAILQENGSRHYSGQLIPHISGCLKKCSKCGVYFPDFYGHFQWHDKQQTSLRNDCVFCHRINKRANNHNRRARRCEKDNGLHPMTLGEISFSDLRNVLESANGRCYWFDVPLQNDWHFDMKQPLSSGGQLVADNFCVTSSHVNTKVKKDMPLDKWVLSLAVNHGVIHELFFKHHSEIPMRMQTSYL